MNFKSKIKSLIAIVLLSFGLSACDNTPDYSGTYAYHYNKNNTFTFTFEKIKDNKYKLTSDSGTTRIVVIEDKKFVYETAGSIKALYGEFKNKDEFILIADGSIYKKVK